MCRVGGCARHTELRLACAEQRANTGRTGLCVSIPSAFKYQLQTTAAAGLERSLGDLPTRPAEQAQAHLLNETGLSVCVCVSTRERGRMLSWKCQHVGKRTDWKSGRERSRENARRERETECGPERERRIDECVCKKKEKRLVVTTRCIVCNTLCQCVCAHSTHIFRSIVSRASRVMPN